MIVFTGLPTRQRLVAEARSPATSGRRSLPALLLAAAAVGGVAATHAIGQDSTVAEPAMEVESPSPEDGGLFLPVDRGKDRQLDRVHRLIAAGQWGDAVTLLDELLADDRDAFMTDGSTDGTRRSVRTEAARLVAGLPPAGRDAYALLCRGRAERALADALARDDGPAVVAVARRWAATPAGRRACAMAAQTALEAGDPRTAEAWLQRLAAAGDPAWGPSLDVMQAVAAAAAGDREGVAKVAAAWRRAPPATVRIGGRKVSVSADGMEAWLKTLPGVGPREEAGDGGRGDPDWAGSTQPRGDAARNAVAIASPPLLVPRYRVPLTSHPEESRLLEVRRRALAADGVAAVPAGGAVTVGGTIVVRTPLGVLGVDFATGKRLWLAASSPADAEAVIDRTFDDATSGWLSSDGVRVFAVESHPDSRTPIEAPAGFGGGAAAARWRGGNTLVAYDTAAAGAVAWRLPPAEERQDGDAATRDWFLGAPLVCGDDLFVLVESSGRLRLDVLDPQRGVRRWSQPLADLEERQATAHPDAFPRRLSGLTPALGDGVLVCPLGGGTVVAFDLATRSLLWAHAYRIAPAAGEPLGPAGARLRALAVDTRPPTPPRGGDPWPVIAGGRVYLAPYDADGVICLSLRDGAAVWPQPIRGRCQIAGVVGDTAVLVAADRVDAIDAATGRVRWTRPHAQGVRPSGRGLLTASRLFLPVDAPGVVEIDLADGAVVGRHAARGGGPPGNLVAFRGEVISRGIDSLDVYHQVGDLEKRVETAAVDERRRPWADYWRGQLDLTAGDVAAALGRVRAAASAVRPPPAAVAEALVFALRRDFGPALVAWRSWDAAGDAAAVEPEVLRAVVDGSLRQDDDVTAWRACRRLLDVEPTPGGPLIIDPLDAALEVDPGRWLRGRLAELARRGDPARRRAIADALAGGSPPARRAVVSEPSDPAAEEWPLGRVTVRRERRTLDADEGMLGGQIIPLPLVGTVDPVVPGISVGYDVQHRRLLVTDAVGRRLVEPLPVDLAAAAMWPGLSPALEPSVVGDTLVVRSGRDAAAFDISTAAAEGRLLWRLGGRSASSRGLVAIPPAVGGRIARHGGVPLGGRITEPEDLGEPRSIVAPPGRLAGVLVPTARSVKLVDVRSGRVLWERRGLPQVVEWIADEEAACGCTADGRGSPVLSMCDGRLLHEVDLPRRSQRFESCGRHLVAVVPGDDGPLAARVRLDRIDPLRREALPLGEFSGDARAKAVGDGRLAVLAADGTLTLIDVAAAAVVWQVRLRGGPPRVDEMHVAAWRDRYLVFAAAAAIGVPDPPAHAAPWQEAFASSDTVAPLSGAVWAVGRDDGRLLWPVAATVRQHVLLPSQPADLPVLVFCRQTHAAAGRREVRVLCLDKRTGHAVTDELRLPAPSPLLVGCEVAADPRAHTISIRMAGGTAPAVTLAFTGAPLPPQPPFQAEGRLPTAIGLGEPGGTGIDDRADVRGRP